MSFCSMIGTAAWCCTMSLSVDFFSGLRSSSSVPAGRAAKAASVGAKTV
jgi:hypothetical protein